MSNPLDDKLARFEELDRLLVEYGHAEYTTDATKYREAAPKAQRHAAE